MNTQLMFSSKDHDWETPPEIFNKLNEEFHFTLDPCCVPETAKCNKFYTPGDNGLTKSWGSEVVFVNPPYGRELKNWVIKSRYESMQGATVVMLIPSRTDTSYFHDNIYGKAEIRFMRGRVKFLKNGETKDAAPFPTMIVVFRPPLLSTLKD